MLHDKARPGDCVGVGALGLRARTQLVVHPDSRPCSHCGSTCAAVFCTAICEDRAYNAWRRTVNTPIPIQKLTELGVPKADVEGWVKTAARQKGLSVFWGRNGPRAVGRPPGGRPRPNPWPVNPWPRD